MKILKVVKKLMKFYWKYGNVDVQLPQVSGEGADEHEWLAQVSTVGFNENKDIVEIY
jgi:hypothetical protein